MEDTTVNKRSLLFFLCLFCSVLMLASAHAVSLPGSLTEIEDEAFCGNVLFEHVVLPEGVTAIGSRSFAGCTGLKTVYVPSSVTRIAEDAFADCGDVTLRCAEDSYAWIYASAAGDNVDCVPPGRVSVTLNLSATMLEGPSAYLNWSAEPAYSLEGDWLEYTVMLNKNVYQSGTEDDLYPGVDAEGGSLWRTHFDQTGEACIVVHYHHGDGENTHLISPKVLILGELSASLTPASAAVSLNDVITWKLSTQEAAGIAAVQYTVYKDGAVYHQSGVTTDTQLQATAAEAGVYTAEATVTDGLGREITVQSSTVTAAQTGAEAAEDPLYYELSSDGSGYTVTGCDLDAVQAVIPAERNGLPVCAIGKGAFIGCENLDSAYLPESVKTIGAYAFHGCENLLWATIACPDAQMGDGVFSGCTSLETLPLPAQISKIPAYYAQGCTGISSLTLPGTVTAIGKNAFTGCTGLSALSLPDALTALGSGAFADCTGLSSVSFGAGLTEIGPESFSGCTSLADPVFPETLKHISDRAFTRCAALKELRLPESVKSIGASAFAGCENLQTVLIGDINAVIGAGAFDYCSSVEVQTFGAGSVQTQLEAMGISFRNIALAVLTRAEMVTHSPAVGRSMLWQAEAAWGTAPYTYSFRIFCNQQLQAESGSLSDGSFRHLPERSGQYYAEVTVTDAAGVSATRTTPPYDVAPFEGATLEYLTWELINDGAAYAITGIGNLPETGAEVVIPSTIDGLPVTEISTRAAKLQTGLTSLVIPDSVTHIGYEAFYKCTSLKSVTLGSGMISVDERAFWECSGLEELSLPYGLQEIGVQAFYNCISLRDLTIPSTVTVIGAEAFFGCVTFTHITVPASVAGCGNAVFQNCVQLREVFWNAALSYIPDKTFYNCARLDTVEIGYPVQSIGTNAFALSGLAEITGRLEAVETVGEKAFYQCANLRKIELPAKLERLYIGSSAFRECTSLESVILNKETILKPYGYAFYGCTNLYNLTCKSINLYAPNNGASFGEYAFAGCTSLTQVRVDGTLDNNIFENCTSLHTVIFETTNYIEPYAFRNCTSLRNLRFPPMRTDTDDMRYTLVIETGVFQNCTGLTTVSFPQNPGRFVIGERAFENCVNLTSVSLPSTSAHYRRIEARAFLNCTSLTTVSNARHVLCILDEAFKNCISLSSIRFANSEPEYDLTIGTEAFANCRSLTSLAFDKHVIEIGENAFAGCSNLSVTVEPDTYAAEYFASNDFGTASASSLLTELSAEVAWDKVDNEQAVMEGVLTIYNTRNGPMPTGSDWLEMLSNSAISNVNIQLQRSSKAWHDVWLVDSTGVIDSIPYRGSASVRIAVNCKYEPAAGHDHGLLYVDLTADGHTFGLSPVILDKFTNVRTSDWYITEPTAITSTTTVEADVYVQDELTITGALLSCKGNVYVQRGGTIIMEGNASLSAENTDIQSGGEIRMAGGASVRTSALTNTGSLALLTSGAEINADSFSVNGSGILNLMENSKITTDVLTFNTSASHASLLTNGVITAREAFLNKGFHASENQTFVLTGGKCLLDVTRTSPLQRFSALVLSCPAGDLTVENIGAIRGLPFECDHFAMAKGTLENELVNGNTIAKAIYDHFTAARLEQMTEAEEELSKVMKDWYTLTLDYSNLDPDKQKAAIQASTFAGRGVLRWALEAVAEAPDKWSGINDVIRSISVTSDARTYSYTEGSQTYSVHVQPLGGLTISAASAAAGKAVVTCGDGEFTYIFSLSERGIRENSEALLEVLRKYGEEEFVKYLNKAVEEALGKENAKYALAVVKVVETSLIEEKTLYEVIADKYGKAAAKKLITEQFPEVKKVIDFVNKWDKFLKQTDKVTSLAVDVRTGDALPTELMTQFLSLTKLVP